MTASTSLAYDTRFGAESISDAPDKKQIRVLMIEDERSDVYIVSRMLRDASPNHGFAITDVPRLGDAIRCLDEAAFDVILLDLNLLDITGVAAVAALHAQASATPIIVYSGSLDPQLRQGALMCGARHYMTKGKESPFSLRIMIQQAILQNKETVSTEKRSWL